MKNEKSQQPQKPWTFLRPSHACCYPSAISLSLIFFFTCLTYFRHGFMHQSFCPAPKKGGHAGRAYHLHLELATPTHPSHLPSTHLQLNLKIAPSSLRPSPLPIAPSSSLHANPLAHLPSIKPPQSHDVFLTSIHTHRIPTVTLSHTSTNALTRQTSVTQPKCLPSTPQSRNLRAACAPTPSGTANSK